MTQYPNGLACHEFEALLPELIGSGEKLANQPHPQHCALCRALLTDLKAIAEAARELLPFMEPPDEVWKHIETVFNNEKDPGESERSPE